MANVGMAAVSFALSILAIGAALYPCAAADSKDEVAAQVNDRPIYVGAVQTLFDAATAGKTISPDVAARLKSKTLEQLIDRRLIADYLERQGLALDEAELELAENRARRQLAARKTPLEKVLADRRLTPEAWRERLAWQAAWDRYVARELTDEALEKYFESHKSRFDGTERQVSQIFFKADPQQLADVERAVEKASRVRSHIVDGKSSFATAAKEHSDAPSRAEGGDMGLVPRVGLVSEPLAAAAFALGVGEVSQPVKSPFGVHLLLVTREVPGERTFGEVRESLRASAAADLREKLAARLRRRAKIEYTSNWPHGETAKAQRADPAESIRSSRGSGK